MNSYGKKLKQRPSVNGLAWEEQEGKSREAEAGSRSIAQKSERTTQTASANIDLPFYLLWLTRKPPVYEKQFTWFKKNELPRGTGLDPKTGLPAPWNLISRDASEQLLVGKPTGSFLVRVSERIWGYTVSYVVGNECLSDTKYELTERQACLQKQLTSFLRVIFESKLWQQNNVVKTHDRYAQSHYFTFGTNQSQEFLDVLQWKHLRPLISSMLYILDQGELNRDLLLEALEMCC
ncbi:unnamed protein product, partial [Mesorhabditis belari]|uniref:SH2 domain-containing protein n=1 Tax=Mesorhabditis belari TaxID=2138241 RepID=A0AAF3JBM4_9BILA